LIFIIIRYDEIIIISIIISHILLQGGIYKSYK